MKNGNLEIKKNAVLEAVEKLDDEAKEFVCDFVKDGYKNLLAELLVFTGEDKAEKTLSELPAMLAADLKNRAAGLKSDDKKVVKNALHVLENFDREKIKAALKIARKNSDYVSIRKYDDLFKANPFLKNEIKDGILSFEDIKYVDDFAIMYLLDKTGNEVLACALRGASEEVRSKIFRHLSKSEIKLIKNKMKNDWLYGWLKIDESFIHNSQQEMLRTLYWLEEDNDDIRILPFPKNLASGVRQSKKQAQAAENEIEATDTKTATKNKPEFESKEDLTLEAIKKLDSESKDFLCNFVKNGYKNLLVELLVFVGEEKAEKTLAELPSGLSPELKKFKSSLKIDDDKIEEEANFVLEDFYFGSEEKIAKTSKIVNQAFERIEMLDDWVIERLLQEIDTQDLAKALMDEKTSVQEKIFQNMSKRAASMLKEDIDWFAWETTKNNKIEARRRILDVIKLFIENWDAEVEKHKEIEKIQSEFNKISLCSDKTVKKLLREIDITDTLPKALNCEDESLKKKFFKNMSRSDRNLIKGGFGIYNNDEELEAKRKILDTLKKIESEEKCDRQL